MVLVPVDGRPVSEELRRAAMKVWWAASFEERSACQRVWVHNSRATKDLKVMGRVMERVQQACAHFKPESN